MKKIACTFLFLAHCATFGMNQQKQLISTQQTEESENDAPRVRPLPFFSQPNLPLSNMPLGNVPAETVLPLSLMHSNRQLADIIANLIQVLAQKAQEGPQIASQLPPININNTVSAHSDAHGQGHGGQGMAQGGRGGSGGEGGYGHGHGGQGGGGGHGGQVHNAPQFNNGGGGNGNGANGSGSIFASASDFFSYCRNNKLKLVLLAAGGTYAYLCQRIISTNRMLKDPFSWGVWHNEKDLIQLSTMPQKLLKEELMFEIASRYMNLGNPTDSSGPLKLFFKSIDKEKEQLTEYVRIYSWLKSLRLTLFFPINASRVKMAKKQLKRVDFLRSFAASSVAEHNYMQMTFGGCETRRILPKRFIPEKVTVPKENVPTRKRKAPASKRSAARPAKRKRTEQTNAKELVVQAASNA